MKFKSNKSQQGSTTWTILVIVVLLIVGGGAFFMLSGRDGSVSLGGYKPGTEEFGLSMEELMTNIEKTETEVASCMQAEGFEYIPVDAPTVLDAMSADQTFVNSNQGDREYAAQFGFGISTQAKASSSAPQNAGENTVVQLGLGARNIAIFNNLSTTDQVAYNQALFGDSPQDTFAITLEREDFSNTDGCTREAIAKAFNVEELSGSYSNPKDKLMSEEPRFIAAVGKWSSCMQDAGFNYNSPDDVEPDLEDRLDAITQGEDPESLSSVDRTKLTRLQGEEKAIAVAAFDCEEEHIVPAETEIEKEWYGSQQN